MRNERIDKRDFARVQKAFLRTDVHKVGSLAHKDKFRAVVKVRKVRPIVAVGNIVTGKIQMSAFVGCFFVKFHCLRTVHIKSSC